MTGTFIAQGVKDRILRNVGEFPRDCRVSARDILKNDTVSGLDSFFKSLAVAAGKDAILKLKIHEFVKYVSDHHIDRQTRELFASNLPRFDTPDIRKARLPGRPPARATI